MSEANQALQAIREVGVIAIMRASSSELLLDAAMAIEAGGIRAIEVTMTTPGALHIIGQAVAKLGKGVSFGAGTVISESDAKAAIQAGAQFIVTPSFDPAVVRYCREQHVPVIPGAFSPTEIVMVWQTSADMVKLFPAGIFGAAYVRQLRAPLPQIPLVPTGGISLDNAADFIRAGAAAIGVSSALVDQKLLENRDFSTLTQRARRLREAVALGREN